jgi:hypothetical protein
MRRCSSFGSDEADQFVPGAPKWVEAFPEAVEWAEDPEGIDPTDHEVAADLSTVAMVVELEARGYLVVRTDRMIAFGKLHETAGRFDLPDPYGNYPRGRPNVLSD